MPIPSGFTQHTSGYWMKASDQSGPYTFDGTNTALAGSVVSVGATQVAAGQTGAAGAIGATLGTAAGKTTYITGFQVTGGGATVGSIITVTVTNVVSGPMSYKLAIPTGATIGVTPLIITFPQPLQATTTNTAIAVSVPSFGAGNTDAAVAAQGFYA
jgi:hypothetical protein